MNDDKIERVNWDVLKERAQGYTDEGVLDM
jgi:hypothetical protein